MSEKEGSEWWRKYEMTEEEEAEEERLIMESLENGTFERVENFKEQKKMLKKAAKNYFKEKKEEAKRVKKESRINIRLNEDDVAGLRKLASEEGLPYQTFIASALHKLVTGRFVDRSYVDSILKPNS